MIAATFAAVRLVCQPRSPQPYKRLAAPGGYRRTSAPSRRLPLLLLPFSRFSPKTKRKLLRAVYAQSLKLSIGKGTESAPVASAARVVSRGGRWPNEGDVSPVRRSRRIP